jgi:outer membrane protein assembly factor BamB
MFEQSSGEESRSGFSPRMLMVVVALALALVAGAYLFLRPGVRMSAEEEAHIAALERHRAEQQQQQPGAPADAAAAAPAGEQPAAASDPAAQAQPGEVAGAQGQTDAPAQGQTDAPAGNSRGRRNYWTDFRGPARDGRYDERPVKTNWGQGLSPVWRQPVGGGYSSFTVADGMAFTIEQRRGQEVVTAYNVETGRELWAHGWDARYSDSTGDGPRSTPTWHEGRLYALGALGELRVLDARNGRLLWSKNILSDNGAENIQWAMAASPLVVDDKVVVMPGGKSNRSVVAYHKQTGARVWGALNDEASYTSPMLVNLAGRRQVLVVTARRAAGLAPENGALLWEYPWANSAGINVAQPIVVGPDRVFLSAGYGKGAALVSVSASGGGFAAQKVWENSSMKNKFNSSVYHDGHIYGLDEGILTCVDAATGERRWKGGRYGYGQLVLASGHLIITSEQGELVLVRATPEQHTEVARFAALEGKTWNVPALADGRLLVRNAEQMACYKLTD